MPAEVKLRQRESTRADPTANIPTTIKNPERVAHRRTELIEVATKLFLERGFHNTSIRDIVRACSFNIASLYMYVSSKEDILYLVALDLMNSIARELGETKLDANSRGSRLPTALPAIAAFATGCAGLFACSIARSAFCRTSPARTCCTR